MHRLVRRAALALGVVFVGIQFVPVTRDNPPVARDAALDAPPEIAALLRRACMDCHSQETRWPWYAHVAPASWLLARDVREGRRHMNLSAWNTWAPARQAHKLEEIRDELEQDEMPPWFYLPLHPEAQLSAAEHAALIAWTRTAAGNGAGAGGSTDAQGDAGR